jgi:hypothetical protein
MLVIQHQTHRALRGAFVILLISAPPSQELEPPANPGRFRYLRPMDSNREPLSRCLQNRVQARVIPSDRV